MLVFESDNMHDLRAEIVEFLRLQMRNAMTRKEAATTQRAKDGCNAQAFALGTAADSLESATFQKKAVAGGKGR